MSLPPKPLSRPEGAGLLARLRAFRRDMFASQPERLHGAWMAELRTPLYASFLVNDPGLVRLVLQERPQDFPKSRILGGALARLLGRSVFVTNGAEWARARALIDPAFEAGRLRDTLPGMAAAAEAALSRLGAGGAVEAEAETAHFAADVIFRTLFSRSIADGTAARVFAAFRAYQRAQPLLSPLDLLRAPGWLPRLRGRAEARAARAIRGLIAGLVAERAGEIAAGTAPDDLATKIMTARDPATGEGFDAREMADQVAIFFLAGHETSASALAWALWLLATHGEAQERVAAEGAALPARPGLADLRGLAFTRDVLRETLRLYPPVPMLLREAAREERFRGRRVARGSLVILSPWHLGRHRRLWEAPDAFDPGRWAAGEGLRDVPREGWLPFSAGPRVCPGAGFAMAEGVIFLARVSAAFRIEPGGPAPRPVAHLTVRSEGGIPLRLSPRG